MNIIWTIVKITWCAGVTLILTEAANARVKTRRHMPAVPCTALSAEDQLDIDIHTREISS